MRTQLEAIAQTLAREMETTGTIVLDGRTFSKHSMNLSPYASLCRPAIQKLASLVKDNIPKSRVDGVSFIIPNGDPFKCSKHVVAVVTTEEGVFRVDPTIRQYVPNAQMVYADGEQYPITHYCAGSMRTATLYNGL